MTDGPSPTNPFPPDVGSASLLSPGSHRCAGLTDDDAVIAAMLRVEAAWAECLADADADAAAADSDAAAAGAATPEQAGAVRAACERLARAGRAVTAEDAEAVGNPVAALVSRLRDEVRGPAGVGEAGGSSGAAEIVHRGLTSQDVLDTALMLIARDALGAVAENLRAAADALAGLARTHRGTVMAGRTLTRPAVPITFGYKAARWLSGILDALDAVEDARTRLPVQCGGAAGTLSLAGLLVPDAPAAADRLAEALGLAPQGIPWHTQRAPVTRTGDALATVCQALGAMASDVATLSRPEIGEVREGPGDGNGPGKRGGSSTMPHKRNPVLSVLIRSAAIRAPHLAATLHQAAGLANDERPDGAWHAEWPALRELLTAAATAASQAADLAGGLEVDTGAMARNAESFADGLLAEPGGLPDALAPADPPTVPADYTGASGALVDRALDRYASSTKHVDPHETTHGGKR